MFGDGDTGFGNITNTVRTVRELEAAGLAGMFVEDHLFPERCGHMTGKAVVPVEEMVARLKAALGTFDIDPVWYGILPMINLEMALITPPIGVNLFVIRGIAKAPMSEIVRGALPYVFLMLPGLVVLFPELALWLPSTMGYGR